MIAIILLILYWIMKIVSSIGDKDEEPNTKEKKSLRMVFALMWPLLAMAKIFIWNTWAHNWIGWPEITTVEQYLVTLFFL